jgi:hypothetical protein
MQEAKLQLAELTRSEAKFSELIDWNSLDISRNDTIDKMAAKVIDELTSIDESERAIVAMATLCKLLVENLAFQAMIDAHNNSSEK